MSWLMITITSIFDGMLVRMKAQVIAPQVVMFVMYVRSDHPG